MSSIKSYVGMRLVRTLVGVVLLASVTSALLMGGGTATNRGAEETVRLDAPINIELVAVKTSSIFLEVAGFTGGESTNDKHKGLSTVNTVTSGVSRPSGAAKATAEPFTITKPIDGYTIQFAKAVSTGIHIPTVRIYFTTSGTAPIDVFVYTLTDVVVTRSAQSFRLGDSTETVVLAFKKIQMQYRKQNTDGSTTLFTYCWDFQANLSCA